MNEIVAVVDDEEDLRDLVSATLSKEGLRIRAYADGKSFLASLTREVPSVVILDLMLPDMDGFEIYRILARDPRMESSAVIMLTARGDESDRVSGLELGADDYIVKPFSPKELAARVKAVMRRTVRPRAHSTRFQIGEDLSLDLETYEVTACGEKLILTTTEFKIIELLASRPGWVFSREKILDHLWGDEKTVTERSVDVHIKHLRDKLGRAGRHLGNVRGVGYRIRE
jgi:two-component system phosphate regulon response regulator PhoB/two-component system alkaline phosphatase synthesis response regulator PhoP